MRRATPARATCGCDCTRDGDALQLVIEDDGRVQRPLHPGHGLTGMRERVAALGGELDIEHARRRRAALRARLPRERAGMTLRIALADDQALVREGLKALLRDFGIEVVLEAGDGQRSCIAARDIAVDVIVSDVRMPGLDGIALTRALRERGDATPVVLLTTFDDSELLLRAVQAGAQAFLLKDASPEDLRDASAAPRAARTGSRRCRPIRCASASPIATRRAAASVVQRARGQRSCA